MNLLRTLLFFSLLSFSFNLISQTVTRSSLPCVNKKFTIVAHLIKDINGDTNVTENEILLAVEEVNGHFSKICISFEICEFRYIDNYQYDSLSSEKEAPELIVKNRVESRINMFFIEGFTGEKSLCGKAALGGIAGFGNVYVLKNCLAPGDFTMSHEMGHYFGLEHTFAGNGNELVDGSNCAIAGDEICDTPADPYNIEVSIDAYVQNCQFTNRQKDANGDFYNPDIGNIMSYYPCKCRFSDGQYRKMVEVYEASNPKTW